MSSLTSRRGSRQHDAMIAYGRIAAALLVAALALASSGCLVVDARIDANGGGTLKLQVSQLDESGDERMRRELSSPSVKLVSASYAKGVGNYEVSFTDADKLRTAPLFRNLRVELQGDAGQRTLTLVIPRRERSADEQNLPADDYVVLDLGVTLPGTIVETNGDKASDSKATWKYRVGDLLGTGRITARAVYAVAAEAPAS